MMRLAMLLWLLASGSALAAEPFVRAAIEDSGEIVPGQQVRLTVDIFVPDFFTSPPQFPLFEVQNAMVTLPEERSFNMTQTIDGVQYSGIRRDYQIVPEAPGSYTLPDIPVDLGYSVQGKPTRATVIVSGISFTVGNLLPGQSVFAARDVTLEQSFDPDPSSLKAGDALTRTITITALDTQAIMMPPAKLGDTPGLRQYVKPAKTEDGIAIGREAGSRRIETIVYTAGMAGTFNMPPVSYPWFDLQGKASETATLPGVKVTVGNASVKEAIAPKLSEEGNRLWGEGRLFPIAAIAIALAAALLVIRRLAPRVRMWLSKRRHDRHDSRASRLHRLTEIVRTGDESAVYSALQAWACDLGYRTIADWLAKEDSPVLRQQIDLLERRLFAGQAGTGIDRSAIAKALARRAVVTGGRKPSVLPPLNPVTPG